MGKTIHQNNRSKRASTQSRKHDGTTTTTATDDVNTTSVTRRECGLSGVTGVTGQSVNSAGAGAPAMTVATSGGTHRDGGQGTNVGGRRTSVTRGGGGGGSGQGQGGSKTAAAQYSFAHPLSDSLRSVDLSTLARGVRDWKTLAGVKPCDELEEKIVDRLIQLERLQLQTIEQERVARRLRCAPAVAATVDRLNGSNQQQSTQQPSRFIRIPSATSGGQSPHSPGASGNRRTEAAPAPQSTYQESSMGYEKPATVVQCRLCQAHHSADTDCDCSVGSNFVYVSRSLRSQIAESLLAAGFNNNNKIFNNGFRGARQISSLTSGDVSAPTTSSAASGASAASNIPPPASIENRSARSQVNRGVTMPCLQVPPSRDVIIASRGSSPSYLFDDQQQQQQQPQQPLPTSRPSTRSRYRSQFQTITGGLVPVGGPYGGRSLPPSSDAVNCDTTNSVSTRGLSTPSAPMTCSTVTGSPADFIARQDLIHDFKLLGIRLFQTNAIGMAGGGNGNGILSVKTGVASDDLIARPSTDGNVSSSSALPTVGDVIGSFFSEPIVTQPSKYLRRAGSCISGRRSEYIENACVDDVASSFPYYRKMALAVHPELVPVTTTTTTTPPPTGNESQPSSSLSASTEMATTRNVRFQCSGKAACWTACCIDG